MKQYSQIEFYAEPVEDSLAREVLLLKEQCEKVRKSQYAKIGHMMKLYEEIKRDHEDFKAAICKGKYD